MTNRPPLYAERERVRWAPLDHERRLDALPLPLGSTAVQAICDVRPLEFPSTSAPARLGMP